MHYDPAKDDHGLPYNPFKSCVIPRPIGWISTTSPNDVDNLAPYSQFQNLTYDPPMVMFSANLDQDSQRKHSVDNAEQTGQFVWNMATYDLREAVNLSAQNTGPDVDEFELAKLTKAPSVKVTPPRVAQSPVQFECEYVQTIRLPGNGAMGSFCMVIGKVVHIHIADEAISEEGRLDVLKIRPIARCGYYDYTSIESLFEMKIPGSDTDRLKGLEGRPDRAKYGEWKGKAALTGGR